jgi:predicted ABC-type sugar transport system permease subunit
VSTGCCFSDMLAERNGVMMAGLLSSSAIAAGVPMASRSAAAMVIGSASPSPLIAAIGRR